MNRFVGLSLMCLMFVSTHADPEISGSSWSLQMSQNNSEPIQVQTERKEYDKTGVTLHRKTKGIIENGIYKTIDDQDLNNVSGRKSHDIDALLKIADQYENERKDLQGNRGKVKHHPRGTSGFKKGKDWSFFNKHHPRRYRRDHWENLEDGFGENSGDEEQMIIYQPRGISDPFENSNDLPKFGHHPKKHPGKPRAIGFFHMDPDQKSIESDQKSQKRMAFADSTTDPIKDRLKNRSKVSFYRPVERMFEKIFGTKKHGSDEKTDLAKTPERQFVIKHRLPERMNREKKPGGWFEDFDKHNRAAAAELLRSMQEFEDSFFEEYYGTEE